NDSGTKQSVSYHCGCVSHWLLPSPLEVSVCFCAALCFIFCCCIFCCCFCFCCSFVVKDGASSSCFLDTLTIATPSVGSRFLTSFQGIPTLFWPMPRKPPTPTTMPTSW